MIFNFLLLPLAIFAASCQVKADNENSDKNVNINNNKNSVLGNEVSKEIGRKLLRENISSSNLFQGNEEKNNAIVAATRQNGLFFKTLLYDILKESSVVPEVNSAILEARIRRSSFFLDISINDGFIDQQRKILSALIDKAADLGAPIEQINLIINAFTDRRDLALKDSTNSSEINEVVDNILTILQNNQIRVLRMMFHLLSLIPVNLSNLDTFIENLQTIFNIDNFQGELSRILIEGLKSDINEGKFTPVQEDSLNRAPQISQPSDIITDGVFENPDYNAKLANILARNDRFFINTIFEILYADRGIFTREIDLDGAILLGTALEELHSAASFPLVIKNQLEEGIIGALGYAEVDKINAVISDVIGNNFIQLPSYLFKDFNSTSSTISNTQLSNIKDVVDSLWTVYEGKFLRLTLGLLVLRGVALKDIESFVDSLNETYLNRSEKITVEAIQGIVERAKSEITQEA